MTLESLGSATSYIASNVHIHCIYNSTMSIGNAHGNIRRATCGHSLRYHCNFRV